MKGNGSFWQARFAQAVNYQAEAWTDAKRQPVAGGRCRHHDSQKECTRR